MNVIRVWGFRTANRGAILRKIYMAFGAFVILFGVNSIGSTAEAATHHYYHKAHAKLGYSGHHLRHVRSARYRSGHGWHQRLAFAHRSHLGRHVAHRLDRRGWAGLSRAQVAGYPRITSRRWGQPGGYEQGAYNHGYAPGSNVLSEARRYLGLGNVTGSHRAWCADFVNMVLRKTGHVSSGSGMAQSLLHVGHRVSSPRPGDLVVMRGHVTIFAGYGPRGFVGLGGNQHHRVAMSNFPMHSVVAFVRPR